jgi:predicted flap endonuclease-1-like 5' DNA nuclease
MRSAGFADTGPDIFGGIGEVLAAASAREVEAAAEAEAAPLPSGEADDLLRIKGLGPKLVTLLATLGATRFDQIAAWSEADIERIDAQLGTFTGRIRRDNWVEQAKFLAAGDLAGFEGKFGKL